jgi:hypothetical protein
MLPLDAQLDQSGQGSVAALLRCWAGRSAGCTVQAVVRQWASGTVITGTAPARRKSSSFGSSSNRFADECPLLGVSGTFTRGLAVMERAGYGRKHLKEAAAAFDDALVGGGQARSDLPGRPA